MQRHEIADIIRKNPPPTVKKLIGLCKHDLKNKEDRAKFKDTVKTLVRLVDSPSGQNEKVVVLLGVQPHPGSLAPQPGGAVNMPVRFSSPVLPVLPGSPVSTELASVDVTVASNGVDQLPLPKEEELLDEDRYWDLLAQKQAELSLLQALL